MTDIQGARNRLLAQWIKPSSDTEQERQERAVRRVREAMDSHPAFAGATIKVVAKGSYANNTNVRLDSDVDLAVIAPWKFYYDAPVTPPAGVTPYSGDWTPDRWRSEVERALTSAFGASDVDASGKVAINIAQSDSRPNMDVVPSFNYREYRSAALDDYRPGQKVFTTTGETIINWPDQQLENGRTKNTQTGRRYKQFVRALKNVENALVDEKKIKALPSYLMECLIWNAPNYVLTSGDDLQEGFQHTLAWLLSEFDNGSEGWMEPNQIKRLWRDDAKWTRADADDLLTGAYGFMGYHHD